MDSGNVGLTQLNHLEQVKEEGDAIVRLGDELLEKTMVREMKVHFQFAEQLWDGSELLESHLPVGGHPRLLST